MEETRVRNSTAEIIGLTVRGFPTVAACARYILSEIQAGRGGAAFAINAEKVVSYSQDPVLRLLLKQATLRYPDGAGVVLAMRRRGVATARIPGVELWLAILAEAPNRPIRIALLGARPEVLRQVGEKLTAEFPNVRTVLSRDGFDGVRDLVAVKTAVAEAGPDLVFVAMGTPRQEQLIAEVSQHYGRAYYLGLGGSFDVYCGQKRRAPIWMQKIGLEWLFRFLIEPTRAGREKKRLRFLWMLIRKEV